MCAAPVPPTPERIAQKLAELKVPLSSEINYDLPSLFPNIDGWFVNGAIKKKSQLIRKLEPKLLETLHPNEEVLYIAKGVQQSFIESIFMGAMWAAMLNQTVFVLTNLKVLMMRSKSNGTPLHQFWVIFYSEIKELKSSWTGSIALKLADGQKRTFSGIPKVERKTMTTVFENAVEEYQARNFAPATSQSLETLCCHCYDIVPLKEIECPGCKARYWKPGELAMRSLIFPSWGDFLMKHYWFATFEVFGYLFGLMAFVLPFFGPNPPDIIPGVIMLSLFFVFAHVMDSLLTYIVARKGLYARTGPVEEAEI